MNIGEVAAASGVAAKTIRFYEEIGLIAPGRGPNGYRRFTSTDARRLAFIGRARGLGFSVDSCRELLALFADEGRASADVKRLARAHLAEIEAKIAALEAMRETLGALVERCPGDAGPDCAILDALSD